MAGSNLSDGASRHKLDGPQSGANKKSSFVRYVMLTQGSPGKIRPVHRPPRSYFYAFYAGLVSLLLAPLLARAQAGYPAPNETSRARNTAPPLTLDEALREARNANAHLPVAARGVDIARTSVREAKASRSPSLALTSSVNAGGPIAYTTSQGAAQVVGAATLFDGGLRRANLNAANYRLQGAGAGFHVAEKDVDLAVRLWFSEVLRAENEIAFREQRYGPAFRVGLAVAAVVGAAMVYSNFHWLSDVLAGWALGGTLVWMAVAVAPRLAGSSGPVVQPTPSVLQ